MADLGSDFSAVTDIDANWSRVAGRKAYVQAIARRYYTPRGGLFYAPEYGRSIVALLSAGITPSRERAALEAEALKDERTRSATVSFELIHTSLRVVIDLVDSDGPFRLVLDPETLSYETLES